jgi:uncharacterized protein YneR
VIANGDTGKTIEMLATADTTVTIPSSATSSFEPGSEIRILNVGNCRVQIQYQTGVTVHTAMSDAVLHSALDGVTLYYRGNDIWYMKPDGGASQQLEMKCYEDLPVVNQICVLPDIPVGDVVGNTIRIWRDDKTYWEFKGYSLSIVNGVAQLDISSFPNPATTIEVSYLRKKT